MDLVETFRRHGPFLRRRDLLRLGHSDRGIRLALEARLLFRVRHGWYALPSTADDAVQAVCVGGRLTGCSALLSYGCIVPRPRRTELVVPANACRLRRPRNRRSRLAEVDGCRIHWCDGPRADERGWRVSAREALLHVLRHEPREVAIACCDAVIRMQLLTWAELDGVFADAPSRVRRWRTLVSDGADAFGETFFRLRCADAGIRFVPQPSVPRVGHLDGRIGPHTYVEVDGAQHAEGYDGAFGGDSDFESDHVRDTRMTIRGDRVLRFTYRQMLVAWDECVAAMRRAIADDELLTRARARHPYVARPNRKRRRSGRRSAPTSGWGP